MLVLGAGAARGAARARSPQRDGANFVIVGFVGMNDGAGGSGRAPSTAPTSPACPLISSALGAGEVVLALEERRNALPLDDLLRAKTTGVLIHEFSSFIERETGRVDLDSLNPSWLIFSDGFSSGAAGVERRQAAVRRGLQPDPAGPHRAGGGAGGAGGEAGDRGARLSSARRRVGLYGEPFELIKIRSMRIDAEVGGKAVWATKDDPRVTRVGNFIRKVRIDELPQAWSVLKGEMSFVGPRPERPQFVADLEARLPYYAERHVVKPGITGWAQINYPYGA